MDPRPLKNHDARLQMPISCQSEISMHLLEQNKIYFVTSGLLSFSTLAMLILIFSKCHFSCYIQTFELPHSHSQ